MKILIFAPLILAACATSSEMYAPNGSKCYWIDCSSKYKVSSWGACYQKASELCGNSGYTRQEKIDYGKERKLLIACVE